MRRRPLEIGAKSISALGLELVAPLIVSPLNLVGRHGDFDVADRREHTFANEADWSCGKSVLRHNVHFVLFPGWAVCRAEQNVIDHSLAFKRAFVASRYNVEHSRLIILFHSIVEDNQAPRLILRLSSVRKTNVAKSFECFVGFRLRSARVSTIFSDDKDRSYSALITTMLKMSACCLDCAV